MPGEFFALAVDHLFGRDLTCPGLSMRDRRMGRDRGADRSRPVGSARVQVNAVLHNDELTIDELRNCCVHYPLCRLPAGLAAEQCDRAGSGCCKQAVENLARCPTRKPMPEVP